MMITPSKRRSFQDHRDYYNNVQPKVQTRWPNGTPLIRNGKIVNNKLIRRNSESCLSTQMSALLSPDSFIRCAAIEEEPDNFDEGYTPASLSLDSSNDHHDISTSLDISMHLDIVSGHFKSLFGQLESYHENKAKTEVEKNFIQKQIEDFKEQAKQIDFMITDLIERGERLEKFLQNRTNNKHWAD